MFDKPTDPDGLPVYPPGDDRAPTPEEWGLPNSADVVEGVGPASQDPNLDFTIDDPDLGKVVQP